MAGEPRDMIADGLAWQTRKLKQYASKPVIYSRDLNSVQVQATFGMQLLKLDDGFGGIRLQWTDMDFLIPAADLFFFAGAPITPHRGDKIAIVLPDWVKTFEVIPFEKEPPWRWSDPHQTMYRIHTKHIDTQQFYS